MLENPIIWQMASFALTVAAVVAVALLYRRLRKLENFQKKFFSGKTGTDLEALIVSQEERLQKVSGDIKKLSSAHRVLADLHQLSIQKVGVVRFNSYAEAGGNNSSAVALLDAHDNGVVISSLYGRDTSRVYVKPIVSGNSEIPLTEEEKQAILDSQRVSDA